MYPIELNNVSKKFRKGEKVYSLRDAIPALFKKALSKTERDALKKEEFWAVEDVSFKVKKGEVLGIIGHNGAGKSTILKILSRIMNPTTGEFKIRGRLSALIEVTAGFHPEFTGRENIYFNGAILGMSNKEIDEKFEEIVEFSGVREFIDTPVKRYSSGMMARLGFAISSHVDPDVLLVDEVLSVGDMTFQEKCTKKMMELLESGVTIILISHNIQLVQAMCERVILLDKGKILMDGCPEEVVPYYKEILRQRKGQNAVSAIKDEHANEAISEKIFIEIDSVSACDAKGKVVTEFEINDPIGIKMNYEIIKDMDSQIIFYEIIRSDGIICCDGSSGRDEYKWSVEKGTHSLCIHLNHIHLTPGSYYLKVFILSKDMSYVYTRKKEGEFKVLPKGKIQSAECVFLSTARWKNKKLD